ncbi:hypothetical protein NDU88_001509 [Pleurodeles waltl]|uniref:Uncharacterized protein n=1 Tax=Pleurodeles waltl TaxID=8319 RepID=A0AAV7VZ62_PLEWA|nr:hypothetical protein NDU88_001509 [Pleurodeles waltl]
MPWPPARLPSRMCRILMAREIGLVHSGPRAPPRSNTVSSAISGPAGRRAKGSAPPASVTPPIITLLEPQSACGKRYPGIAVCPQRFLPRAAAPSYCDSPILPVLGHVYCFAPPVPLLVLRATSVGPRGAPIYVAILCRRSVFFFSRLGGVGPRSQSCKVLSVGAPIDILHGSGPMGPRDHNVTTALLTSGRRSEFLQQSDPACPGPRVLPRTADSSSGSPSHECVAARSSDLYSHTLPKICLFFPFGGPGRKLSLVRSYRPGCRLISSTALAPWGPGIAVCPQRFLPRAVAPSFCDSPILPVLGHVYCLAPPIPLLVLRATSVGPRGATICIAKLCRRSNFFRPEGRAAIPVS